MMRRPRRSLAPSPILVLILILVLGLASSAMSQEPSYDLPRLPMRSPDEAQKQIEVHPGFHVERVAAEPLLRSPVAIDFDEDARAYIAEFPEYNQQDPKAKKDPKLAHERGLIRRLEDRDGDGTYETSSIFAENVPMATSVACWDGGIYAGSPPDLLYLKDTNGDGKADVRRVVYTGFGLDPSGEGMINSFRWGLDNRFHLSTSNDGGSVRRGDRASAQTVSVRGYGFLLDPRTETFELTGGGGQHGHTLDDWGRAYVCANSEPFYLIMYDSRYVGRNPYLRAPAAAVNVAPAGKFTKLFRISPVEPWRALRTRMRTQGLYAGSDEGGKPSGFFTGASGVTVYRGDAYPPEYRGNLFVGEVSNNLIHRAIPEPRGLMVTARDADVDREFLASRDCFFRPVQMANAPDGCLWVLDMCRELIETTVSLPPEITRQMEVTSGVDRGRIWRIAPEGFRPRTPRLGGLSSKELAALLEHPNAWHRETAARLLYQRQDRSAVPALRERASHSKSPIGRAQALSTLAGLGALEVSDVLAALDDAEAQVRAQAVRLSEPFLSGEAKLSSRLGRMADDPDAMVRYQLAFSIGQVPGDGPAPVLARLAIRDASDPWMRLAILSSASKCAGALFARLAADPKFRSSGTGSALLIAIVEETGASGRPADLEAIFGAIDGPASDRPALVRGVVLALRESDSAEARRRLSASRFGSILAGALADARSKALNDAAPMAARVAAIRSLRLAELGEVESALVDLLEPRRPYAVQAEAVATLARFDDPRIPTIVLSAWPTMGPRLRAEATEAMFSRPTWVKAFLDAVESGKVTRGDLDPARVVMLKSYSDAAIRDRASRLFSEPQARRRDVVDAYQEALKLRGDPARGREVFRANCSTCHRLEGYGHPVGADITAIRDRGLPTVLLNILDPNREVMPKFLSYVLSTTDGRILSGILTSETASSLTIRRPDGREETVLRIHIDELRSTGLSYMPEGLEKTISIPAMADLLAYLNGIR